MTLVLVGGSAVNQNVVEIDDYELTSEGSQHLSHQTHEGAWGVGEAEGHHEPFVEPIFGLEGRLPFVSRVDSHLVVSVSDNIHL